ncbi:MAG: hypothetical protein ABSH51_24400 [Solirubrobacteraceae bacterium]
MKLQAVRTEDWVLGGVALALAFDLIYAPWFSFTIERFTFSWAATADPDGWLGTLAVIASLLVVADLVIDRASPQNRLPRWGADRRETRFNVACIAAVFVALKFLFNIHFDLFGYGFWGGVVLSAVLVYVALQARRGAGRT